jgi:hypothetical protein
MTGSQSSNGFDGASKECLAKRKPLLSGSQISSMTWHKEVMRPHYFQRDCLLSLHLRFVR